VFLRLSLERQHILLIKEFRAGSAQDGNDVHIADVRGSASVDVIQSIAIDVSGHISALDHVDGLEGFGAYQVTGLSETTT